MHWLSISIDVPSGEAETAGAFWSQALGWELGRPWRGHPEFRSLTPRDGDGYAHIQETGATESSVHFDIGAADVGAECERLLIAGATQEADHDIWRVLKSPGGFAFCVVPSVGSSRPTSTQWPGGHRSRLVQVCIDSPADLLEIEVTFWREVTGWDFRPSTGEFAGKLYPPDPGPVQLLFQRLGGDDAGKRVRAHLDLGADDREAEAARLEALGATREGSGDGWILLSDPNGMPFCATGNAPD